MSEGERKNDLKLLYRKWKEFKRYLKSIGCPDQEVEDVFQEALVIYSRRREDPNFVLTVDAFHYVKNVGKFLWYNQARKRKIDLVFDDSFEVPETSNEFLEQEMKLRKVESALEKLGAQCRNVINSFYGLGMSMREISLKFGFRNETVAKALKYRCLQKAKEFALQASEPNQNDLKA